MGFGGRQLGSAEKAGQVELECGFHACSTLVMEQGDLELSQEGFRRKLHSYLPHPVILFAPSATNVRCIAVGKKCGETLGPHLFQFQFQGKGCLPNGDVSISHIYEP